MNGFSASVIAALSLTLNWKINAASLPPPQIAQIPEPDLRINVFDKAGPVASGGGLGGRPEPPMESNRQQRLGPVRR
jgi:hypothetical protein